MTKRRARLNDDNDPLSSTDRVLSGFEQISKSTSQKADKSTSQQDDVSPSQQKSNTTSQQSIAQHLTSPNTLSNTLSEHSTSQQPDKITSQEDDTVTSQPDSKLTTQQANLLASQQVNAGTLPSVEKPKLRKSTFQISSAVLHQLDQLHLTLQLELGKANAPYKEVIVEEALVRLLESVNFDRAALIEALVSRQKSRDKI